MRIVLAGATGFIGKRLCEVLSERHNELFVLTRSVAQVVKDAAGRTLVPWDGRSIGGWWEFVEGSDAIINLAGESIASGKWTPDRKHKILSSRIDATCAIVQAIKNVSRRPKILINASATGYYGHVPDDDVTETSPRGKGFLAEVCECWEESALRAAGTGVRVVLARFGVVLEKNGGMLGRMIPAFRSFLGGPLGNGEQWIPWIHRDDLIEALIFLLWEDSLSGPVNVTAPVPQKMDIFCNVLGKIMKRPNFLRVPPLALRILLGEMAEIVLTGQKALPRKLTRSGFGFKCFSLEQALLQILGHGSNQPA